MLSRRKIHFQSAFMFSALALLLACSPAPQSSSTPAPQPELVPQMSPGIALERATPESVGMDSERLSRVTGAMQDLVDEGRLAGVVTAAVRDNKLVHFESVGYRDLESQDPMTNDAIFRIYSMSKPITGVAMMILYEEGKFRLSDPVEQYLPEFKDLQVFAGVDDDGNLITEPQDHKMTIRELMSHTGGLSYGVFSRSPVDSLYLDADILDANQTMDEFIGKLGDIPLRQQPGSQWHYSVSVDVQGALVERLSGQRFGDFLEQRIFEPLGMTDTDFHVPEEKLSRFAQVYNYDDNGELVAREGFEGANFTIDPEFESGGGGLVGSTMDYLRFSQMLLNGGELDGVRILAPLTVDLMHRNQLPADFKDAGMGTPGTSFGLDFAVIEDPVEAESYSKGEYYWGGAAGTWFWIDPVEDLIFVGMIQQFGNGRPDVRSLSRRLVYQSIMEPKGL
jgi:CubicO group peptidase (beta-lactamase class C family)